MEEIPTPEGAGTEAPKPEIETLETLADLEPRVPAATDTVPLKKFMQEKDGRRDAETRAESAEKALTDLKAQMAQGATIGTLGTKAKEIATKFNVSEEFVAEVLSSAGGIDPEKLAAEIEGRIAPKVAALEQKQAAEQRDRKFEDVFTSTLSGMPEYAGIVNKEAIKALAFMSGNAKKTMAQLIEETYANATPGKRTLETGQPSREPAAPNLRNPSDEDWDKIKSDPAARKEWAADAEAQLRQVL